MHVSRMKPYFPRSSRDDDLMRGGTVNVVRLYNRSAADVNSNNTSSAHKMDVSSAHKNRVSSGIPSCIGKIIQQSIILQVCLSIFIMGTYGRIV